jgi:hypothetical protein
MRLHWNGDEIPAVFVTAVSLSPATYTRLKGLHALHDGQKSPFGGVAR